MVGAEAPSAQPMGAASAASFSLPPGAAQRQAFSALPGQEAGSASSSGIGPTKPDAGRLLRGSANRWLEMAVRIPAYAPQLSTFGLSMSPLCDLETCFAKGVENDTRPGERSRWG